MSSAKLTRAVVSETKNGCFVVSVLIRIGVNTWRESRIKPKRFADLSLAMEYAKSYGEVVA